MQGKMVTITTEGEIWTRDLTAPPGLATLQEAVGGYIQIVPAFDTFDGERCTVFCNEEGKLRGDEFNETATELWENAFGSVLDDVLVGPIVIITGDNELMNAL